MLQSVTSGKQNMIWPKLCSNSIKDYKDIVVLFAMPQKRTTTKRQALVWKGQHEYSMLYFNNKSTSISTKKCLCLSATVKEYFETD